MKRIKMNKYLAMGLGLLITVALFILGKGTGHEHYSFAAGAAAVSLTEDEKKDFTEGEQKVLLAVKKMAVQYGEQFKTGAITKEEVALAIKGMKDELSGSEIKALKDELAALDKVAKNQGTSLAEMSTKLNSHEVGTKSIAEVLKDDQEELAEIYRSGNRKKEYMISTNAKGEIVMKPFDTIKAATGQGTIAIEGGAASITQSFDAAAILRMGADAPIVSAFRNTPWLLPLCNLVNAGFQNSFFTWFDEQAKDGASATVAEAGSKPKVQYKYDLKSAQYKKEACLIGFTEEFSLDFERLQSEILKVAQIDLVNRINSAILANVRTASTAYNSGAAYMAAGDAVVTPNDWDAVAAMAAQVESSTFASMANTLVVSTNKKYRMGTLKDGQLRWLNIPEVLSNLGIVSNPDMGNDEVITGDLKQYNIALRGGMILRVGYNGTDFAENRFSQVIEQYYFDYISNARKAAIVKGPNFADVKAAITAP